MAVVGVARWVLHLPGCRSLKAKRSVLRSVKDRLHEQFRVSVAETDFHDRWQSAEICVAFVVKDRAMADSMMSKLELKMNAESRALIVDRETAFY